MTTKRSTVKRITEQDWKRVEPAINHFAKVSLDIAHAVLVEGKKLQVAAEEFGRTKQTANAAIKRVKETIEPLLDNRLEYVEVWLPPELADKVRLMAEEFQSSQAQK